MTMHERPINDQALSGGPIDERDVDDRPLEDRPFEDQQFQDRPFEDRTGTAPTEQIAPAREAAVPTQPMASPEGSHGRADEQVPPGELDTALFADSQVDGLRARWDDLQAGFVDDPRECVHRADGLVADVVDQLTASFEQARAGLAERWARDGAASTEELRVALKQYRDFFQRLLTV